MKYIPYILSAWLIIGFSFLPAKKAFSQSGGTSPVVKGITTGRARALVGVAVGLVSLVTGWRVKLRSSRGTGNERTGAIVALGLGLIGIVLSVVHLSITAGAVFGSGSGKAGAIFGLALGLLGMTLGALSLRSRKIG